MFRCEKCGREKEYSSFGFGSTGFWYCQYCNKCYCSAEGKWDPSCRDPLHRQIYDRPIGMTD